MEHTQNRARNEGEYSNHMGSTLVMMWEDKLRSNSRIYIPNLQFGKFQSLKQWANQNEGKEGLHALIGGYGLADAE